MACLTASGIHLFVIRHSMHYVYKNSIALFTLDYTYLFSPSTDLSLFLSLGTQAKYNLSWLSSELVNGTWKYFISTIRVEIMRSCINADVNDTQLKAPPDH